MTKSLNGKKTNSRKRKAHPREEKEEEKFPFRRRPSKQALIAEVAATAYETNKTDEHHDTNHHSPSSVSMSIQEMSDVIAELSESILANPQGAFQSAVVTAEIEKNGETTISTEKEKTKHPKKTNENKNNDDNDKDVAQNTTKLPSPMAQLLSIARAQETPVQEHTARLALLSLLAVFKDLIPGDYRIRLPTEKEMAVKVSKEIKQLWDYERQLLHHYQLYLQLLEKTWDKKGKNMVNSNPKPVAIVAILSLAELLKSAFHFNFRSNLLQAVVRSMNHPAAGGVVGDACCEAIRHVFAKDVAGDVALEAARQVAKMIQHHRQFKVRPAVLQTFTALPLRVHVDEAQAAKLATRANAKKRKKDKELAAIEAELKEGNATVDKIQLARNQADTLQTVILLYFRILKSDDLLNNSNTQHMQPLLPAALEGLAKFAHLINIDTVLDLLQVLKQLLKKNVDTLPLDAALNCILTAFATLQGPGRELQIDPKEYVVPLYSQIPRITENDNALKHTGLLLECLNAAFLKQKEFSHVRVAAFLKQIWTACLHVPAFSAVPLLAFGRQLMQRYPATQQLLENEADVITSGEYDPSAAAAVVIMPEGQDHAVTIDPEQCYPYATAAWELATLQSWHYHLSVQSQAKACASGNQLLQLPAELPERLRQQAVEDAGMLYIAMPTEAHKRLLKKHPLAPPPSKEGNNQQQQKKQQQRPRFITPRISAGQRIVVPTTTHDNGDKNENSQCQFPISRQIRQSLLANKRR